MSKEKSQSPLPPKASKKLEIEMSFYDALKLLANGDKIRRLEWDDREEFGLLQDTFLRIYRDGKFYNWTVSEGDMLAIDWVIFKNGN